MKRNWPASLRTRSRTSPCGPLSFVSGLIGEGSVGALLAQLGIGFTANSVLLKYSRDAERQADLLGTQILYDAGYDPHAMAQFFRKIDAESKGRSAEFLSSHPNPENRVTNVNREIQKMGGAPNKARTDSPAFHEIKRILSAMPAPARRRR